MSYLCYHCFRQYQTDGVCPYCGYDGSDAEKKFPLALKPGSILNGRYTVGRVLGQGGFGITYIAQDYQSKERVAIKEYLPGEFANRTQDNSIQAFSDNQRENYEYGKEQFLSEARTLAAFNGDEHIVRIYSYFEENNTAYFVMEYVDGYALDKYMARNGGRLSVGEANRLLLPLMESLSAVHARGIIHRDIAPDNIIVTNDGSAKLIDFGAARYSTGEKSKSLDVILKHGFAPKEQYMRRGRQGPYTDIYALAATYYYSITGKVPPDAIERLEEDDLIQPSSLGVRIPEQAEDALFKALEINAADRYQSMADFHRDMATAGIVEMPRQSEKQQDSFAEQTAREAIEEAELLEKRAREAREKAARLEREQQERKAREEAERQARELREKQLREEAERKERERKAREAREEAERREQERREEEARRKAERLEQEQKAREEAERKRREQQEQKAREEAARKERQRLEQEAKKQKRAEQKQAKRSSKFLPLAILLLAAIAAAIILPGKLRSPQVQEPIESKAPVIEEAADQKQSESAEEIEEENTETEETGAPSPAAERIGSKLEETPEAATDVPSPTQIPETDIDSTVEAEQDQPVDEVEETAPVAEPETEKAETIETIGSVVSFGHYEQDNDLSNGAEPIEWIVLDIRDGKALLLSRYALDAKPYNADNQKVTWETCSLRSWLNNDFLNAAFDGEEKNGILITQVDNGEGKPTNGRGLGRNTEDMIFLLAKKEGYDTNADGINYLTAYENLQDCIPTEYAAANGVHVEEENGLCLWWQRHITWSSGDNWAVVYGKESGYSTVSLLLVNKAVGIRPAMWIDLENTSVGLVKPENSLITIQSDENEAPDYQKVDAVPAGDLKTPGSVISFGQYEQDNNPDNGSEPIEWVVMDVQDGKSLLLSRYILDCIPYQENSQGGDWERSTIRSWLNDSFLPTAFSGREQPAILVTTVDNGTHEDEYPGKDTQDQVFLLSTLEAKKYFSSDEERKCVATAYAIENGVTVTYNSNSCASWWLRSVYAWKSWNYTAFQAGIVRRNGSLGSDGVSINRLNVNEKGSNNIGVRPAIWVDNTGLSTPGYELTLGHYEQDNDLNNGPEPIEWIVLDAKDGKSLLISKYALDTVPYNESANLPTWELSSLRKWLNNEFLSMAFSAGEMETLPVSTVPNDRGQGHDDWPTSGGNSTKDSVFVLSYAEARNYFSTDAERACIATDYAASRGASVSQQNGGSWWWLRSPGKTANQASIVDPSGSLGRSVFINQTDRAVRPVIWIDQAKLKQLMERRAIQERMNGELSFGNAVSFGHYEQDNDRGNGPEPIEWIVIDEQENSRLLISRYALDCRPYYEQNGWVVWESSSLRKWLNGEFFTTAFSEAESKFVQPSLLNNGKEQGSPEVKTSGGNHTTDHVFVLSFSEAKLYFPTAEERRCEATAFAVQQGAFRDDRNTSCWWWTRSPGYTQNMALSVDANGVAYKNVQVDSTIPAVRPAIWIDISPVG